MDFAFDEDQERFRETTRRFLERAHPVAKTRERLEEDDLFDRAAWREGAALGWTAPLVPEAYGGGSVSRQPLVDLVAIAEEAGRFLYPGPFLSTNVVAFSIASAGTEEQQRRFLPGIAGGSTIATWCFTEDGGCDLDGVAVRARRDGEGYRLEGIARFVPDAMVADLLLVTARADGGFLQFLVPLPDREVRARVIRGLDLTRRFGEVRFDGLVVPNGLAVASPLGAENDVRRQLAIATVLLAAESVGVAEWLFESTVGYSKVRVQFGRPIGSFQAVKHKIANMLIGLEGSRAAAHYAALALADDLPDAADAVHTAGSFVSEAVSVLAGEALQTHGGIGFTWEHDLHLYLRRAKVNQTLFGDPAWHRERLCALAGS